MHKILQLLCGVTVKADTQILRSYVPDSVPVTKYIRRGKKKFAPLKI